MWCKPFCFHFTCLRSFITAPHLFSSRRTRALQNSPSRFQLSWHFPWPCTRSTSSSSAAHRSQCLVASIASDVVVSWSRRRSDQAGREWFGGEGSRVDLIGSVPSIYSIYIIHCRSLMITVVLILGTVCTASDRSSIGGSGSIPSPPNRLAETKPPLNLSELTRAPGPKGITPRSASPRNPALSPSAGVGAGRPDCCRWMWGRRGDPP